jgi:hypothetical protein
MIMVERELIRLRLRVHRNAVRLALASTPPISMTGTPGSGTVDAIRGRAKRKPQPGRLGLNGLGRGASIDEKGR